MHYALLIRVVNGTLSLLLLFAFRTVNEATDTIKLVKKITSISNAQLSSVSLAKVLIASRMFRYPVHLQICPLKASSTCCWVGLGFSLSNLKPKFTYQKHLNCYRVKYILPDHVICFTHAYSSPSRDYTTHIGIHCCQQVWFVLDQILFACHPNLPSLSLRIHRMQTLDTNTRKTRHTTIDRPF